MTWPFENDTSAITKKLAKKSLQSEKRRNLMVVIAVALAAFLICFTGIVSTSLTQMMKMQKWFQSTIFAVVLTYMIKLQLIQIAKLMFLQHQMRSRTVLSNWKANTQQLSQR